MNNKGFTMIELLTAMVLLSILMLTSVPTILGVMEDSRKNTIVNDARKLISKVEYKIKNNNNTIVRPRKTTECIIITLNYLDLGSDFKTGPHGGVYDPQNSYVLVKYKASTDLDITISDYDYYVTLVEKYDNESYYGLYFVSEGGLSKKYVDGFDRTKLFTAGAIPNNTKPSDSNDIVQCDLIKEPYTTPNL